MSNEKAAYKGMGKTTQCQGFQIYSKAKAKKGWLVVVDWRRGKESKWFTKQIYYAKVGGKIKGRKIKLDVWYWFEEGELNEG